ncbi:hypothetical protein FHP25_06020 [Vineibacter terrae]|uniref:Uncharacterized protein n=1 Tax=Vineibacter terrae TaxID=2586908 RepID=A0A5C8PSP2_9HYPH|nr:Ig-like domain-containing protein [Vineibacter terrae]TXL79499.1 hypothetical protein FHP25_06020 [Vineibacter terrae]
MATTTNADFGATLNAAIQGGYVAHLSGQTYTIDQPIVIHVTSTTQGALGIDGGGATLVSQVTNGAPLIQIVVDPGVDLRYLTLSNFTIAGNGLEGAGIRIVADGNDRWVYNWTIDNVTVQHVGGYGLDVQGSVFEGSVRDSWMIDNAKGGAVFAHSAGGGQVSALRWFGGGLKDNGGAGLVLDNGARDLTVDGAAFVNNADVGISAAWGISAVSASTFQDNHGPGVWFQNYGNFNNNTFTTSGVQGVGIQGYLAGSATLVGNTSTYTGAGSDPTALADLQGNGGAFLVGDSGRIVTGSSVAVSGVGGGNEAHVVVDSQGVALPTLAAVSAATTASVASSTGTDAVESALRSAIASGTVTHLTDTTTYTVTAPIVINITSSIQAETGIDLGGAKIISHIAGGGPVIEIIVAPGVDVGHLTLSNFSVLGNGGEGDGIKIVADGKDRVIRDLSINNVNVEHVGGIGLDVLGNVSHGTVLESWMHGNGEGGARFANSAGGGTASGLEWMGGGFRKNGGAGLILDNGAHDMTVRGAYFVDNYGPGLYATSGITLVRDSGFENNEGVGALVGSSANFVDVGFATYGVQKTGVGGYLAGGQVTLTGVGSEYYGWGANPTVLANLQGSGTLAMVGGGEVVAGPNVTMSGGNPVINPPADTTAPAVTERLASDTGASASDKITADPALTGTGDPGAVVHFTVDGKAIAATAMATASGVWSYTPVGLADGQHTVVASQTDAAGNTGTASLIFKLDTTAPVVTERLAGGTATSSPVLTGTGDPDTLVHFTIDGRAIAATTTADASGVWSYTPVGLADGQHTIVASQTDAAGNTGSAAFTFTLATAQSAVQPGPAPVVTQKLVSDTGASSTDNITWDPTLAGTADAGAVLHFTVDGKAITATATADAKGAWSFTPVGLTDGAHTIVASETNAAGVTGTASLAFTLDTHTPIPIFTSVVQSNGQATVSGTTGTANDTISIYDGPTWAGFATTGSDGHFSFTTAAASSAVHFYGANATDLAGSEGHGIGKAILGSYKSDTLSGTSGGDVINGGGGDDKITGGAGADTLSGAAGKDRFVYNAAAQSTPAAADTITDFQHGSDKIDFTTIAGITAAAGVPLFQGNITGSGNLTLNPHSVAYVEAGGATHVLVNTSNAPETVTATDTHAANMEIVLLGVNLGLTASDFSHS